MARGLHVVAGTAKGVHLVAPRGARPTTGRVREALFSSLGEMTGLHVLDLYAGSGALAIEALSRGAAAAVLVDSDRAAEDAIVANLAATRLQERAQVVRAPVARALRAAVPREAPFDLVFADPPYDAGDDAIAVLADALTEPGWVAEGGRVVLERAARQALPALPARWIVGWERKYGDTLVAVLHRSG